jgi:maltooligosyltrehalose synthase
MLEHDPDAGQTREQLVPGWRVPGSTRYDYDLRIGDAERDATMAQLREHFVAGRLTLDELTERIDLALAAKTQGQIDNLVADLPRAARAARGEPPQTASDPDAGRFLVFALLLFALATWILIMAWMSRHAYYGPPYPFQGPGRG